MAPVRRAIRRHSAQLRRYMSKGFSVVFRLYDTTGNLRVTYAPVNIGACGNSLTDRWLPYSVTAKGDTGGIFSFFSGVRLRCVVAVASGGWSTGRGRRVFDRPFEVVPWMGGRGPRWTADRSSPTRGGTQPERHVARPRCVPSTWTWTQPVGAVARVRRLTIAAAKHSCLLRSLLM